MHTRAKACVKPASVQSDINVTPLVDVVLVLLIIFMVVTPLVSQDILVQLPEPPEPQAQPAPRDEKQWVVGVTPEGKLTLDGEPVEDADYVPRLKQVLGGKPAGQRHLIFKPDDRAAYGRLVVALDGAKEAGAELLGVLTE